MLIQLSFPSNSGRGSDPESISIQGRTPSDFGLDPTASTPLKFELECSRISSWKTLDLLLPIFLYKRQTDMVQTH